MTKNQLRIHALIQHLDAIGSWHLADYFRAILKQEIGK